MTLTEKETELILSALRNDRVGTWGDGRQERIESLIRKIEREDK